MMQGAVISVQHLILEYFWSPETDLLMCSEVHTFAKFTCHNSSCEPFWQNLRSLYDQTWEIEYVQFFI